MPEPAVRSRPSMPNGSPLRASGRHPFTDDADAAGADAMHTAMWVSAIERRVAFVEDSGGSVVELVERVA